MKVKDEQRLVLQPAETGRKERERLTEWDASVS